MSQNETVRYECVGGPRDGEALSVHEICREAHASGHRYFSSQDDTGERYWRYAGVVAEAA